MAQGGAQVQTYQYSVRQTLSDSDSRALTEVLEAARLGDAGKIRSLMGDFSDPVARKIALWALIEANPDGMSYAELDGARRDLAGWPGVGKRLAATEKVIEGGGLRPQGIIDWFAGSDPTTPEGAMALASAYQATGNPQRAADVVRHIWRSKPFDAAPQQTMMTRFSTLLTTADYDAREDMLLYGTQGDASRALLPFLSPDQRALAQARMSIRGGGGGDSSLSGDLRDSPGMGYEQALAAERRGDTSGALALLPRLPTALPDQDAQARMWKLRKPLVIAALKAGDTRGAYRAAADSGVDQGADGAEAEFYAGWLALSRMHDPRLADEHFAKLQGIGASPITVSRALYWRGQAAEAMGDPVNAQLGGRDVEQVLAGRGALEPAGCPVGAARGLVGQRHVDPAVVGGYPVRTGQHGDGELGDRDAVRAAVRAVVVQHVVGECQQVPVRVEGRRHPVRLLAGVVDRDEVLGPVFCPADRPAAGHRQPRDQEVLGIELAPDPEPAAGVNRVHVDLRRVDAEHAGKQVSVEDRDLGHPVDVQPAGGSRDRDQAAGFQRHAGVTPDRQFGGDDVRGGGERGVHIAVPGGERRGDLAQRGVGHGGQRVDVDGHPLGGVLARVRVLADHHRDRLPHVPHNIGGQYRLQEIIEVRPVHRQPHRDPVQHRQVGGGDHPDRAGQLSNIDGEQPPVRHR